MIPYFEDESNKDNKYVRNDIRNRIIPAIDENNQLKVSHLLKLKQWHDDNMIFCNIQLNNLFKNL